MSTAVVDSVRAQLAILGLDDVALRSQSAQIEIDRFDYWSNSAGVVAGSSTMSTFCGADAPSLLAA
ncbi:hypothetical protein ACTG9Q_26345 [Actinokineospora sp. 24-640]